MTLLKNFCFCCSHRSGSLFAGIYSMISSGVYIGLLLIRYIGYRFVPKSMEHTVVTYSTFVLFGLLCMTSLILIVGVHTDRRFFLLPWVILTISCIIYGSASMVWLVVVELHRGPGGIHGWEIGILMYHMINTVIHIYLLTCVVSYLQALKDGGSHSRQMRRRMRRQALAMFFAGLEQERIVAPGHINRALSLDGLEDLFGEPPEYQERPPPYTPPDANTTGSGIAQGVLTARRTTSLEHIVDLQCEPETRTDLQSANSSNTASSSQSGESSTGRQQPPARRTVPLATIASEFCRQQSSSSSGISAQSSSLPQSSTSADTQSSQSVTSSVNVYREGAQVLRVTVSGTSAQGQCCVSSVTSGVTGCTPL